MGVVREVYVGEEQQKKFRDSSPSDYSFDDFGLNKKEISHTHLFCCYFE